MKIRLSIVVFIAAIVLSLSFTACMGDAPDGMSADTAETTSGSDSLLNTSTSPRYKRSSRMPYSA